MEKTEWIYLYFENIIEIIKTNRSYKKKYFEEDETFLIKYLTYQIKIYKEKDESELINENYKKFIEIMEFLKENIDKKEVKKWIEDLFNQKNKRKCINHSCMPMFSIYKEEDQIEYIEKNNPKMNQYLLFLDSIHDLLHDQKNHIKIKIFETMIQKIINMNIKSLDQEIHQKLKYKALLKNIEFFDLNIKNIK